jgi:hypothetical protein
MVLSTPAREPCAGGPGAIRLSERAKHRGSMAGVARHHVRCGQHVVPSTGEPCPVSTGTTCDVDGRSCQAQGNHVRCRPVPRAVWTARRAKHTGTMSGVDRHHVRCERHVVPSTREPCPVSTGTTCGADGTSCQAQGGLCPASTAGACDRDRTTARVDGTAMRSASRRVPTTPDHSAVSIARPYEADRMADACGSHRRAGLLAPAAVPIARSCTLSGCARRLVRS